MRQNMDPAMVLPEAAKEERSMRPPQHTFDEFYERERDGLFGALCLITGKVWAAIRPPVSETNGETASVFILETSDGGATWKMASVYRPPSH
ncbi:MAG TPA: hypothetical protein VHI54_10680 [Actinomycetota bacterium]|nr:hypothetical protein [Actinomycetota bacterium]